MSLEIEINNFTGPFDLLLKLIEKQKIDIYDIRLEDITGPYLEEVEKMEVSGADLSEFIYIASILLAIKSQKLLPKEEGEDLEEDLLAYLIEYKRIKEVEGDLRTLERAGGEYFSKYQEDLSQFSPKEEDISQDVEILAQQFQKLMEKFSKKEETGPKFEREDLPDVNSYLIKIRRTLNFAKKLELSSITSLIKNKNECIATFLALLELVKLGEVYLREVEDNSFLVIKRS